MTRSVALLAVVLLVSACGSETGDPAAGPSVGATPATPATPAGAVFTRATVLESGDQGPQLCLGGVMESYPPQCGGPRLKGWDWAELGGFERASGTTWGDYVVIGTYDPSEDTVTLDRPAVPAAEYDGPTPMIEEDEPRGTPCDEAEGGWQVQDPSLNPAYGTERPQRDRVADERPGEARRQRLGDR
jgi:hypothetical protein